MCGSTPFTARDAQFASGGTRAGSVESIRLIPGALLVESPHEGKMQNLALPKFKKTVNRRDETLTAAFEKCEISLA
ncbi:hypothetical protein [Sinorhizobium sp. BJ1]|uniref:hypothetical protein n=1 Tax=Sinorhizobium sp. BJ1 TaxID=2035455 RepID=UPI000BE9E1FA|nr:hypothetical protein [Sinorhizobium sp. BJ1]PDT80547.1 hypothetical protein CO676_27270 [Sinorhizobium sp. BJ1]